MKKAGVASAKMIGSTLLSLSEVFVDLELNLSLGDEVRIVLPHAWADMMAPNPKSRRDVWFLFRKPDGTDDRKMVMTLDHGWAMRILEHGPKQELALEICFSL